MINKKIFIKLISVLLLMCLFFDISPLPSLALQISQMRKEQADWDKILNAGNRNISKDNLDKSYTDAIQININTEEKQKVTNFDESKYKAKTSGKEYITDRFIIKYKNESLGKNNASKATTHMAPSR